MSEQRRFLPTDDISSVSDRTVAEQTHTCPCGYPGDKPCYGCPEGCERRPAGVTGWDHIDNRRVPS